LGSMKKPSGSKSAFLSTNRTCSGIRKLGLRQQETPELPLATFSKDFLPNN
jgi:hypothetical protein